MCWHTQKAKPNAVTPRGKPNRVPAATETAAWLVAGYCLTFKARPLPTESR